jgi:hypothetical protein
MSLNSLVVNNRSVFVELYFELSVAGYTTLTTISNHPHPKASTQRIVGCFAGVGLACTVVGSVGLLIAGIADGLPLLVMIIPFLIGLSLPLFLLTSLHPAITVEEEGLRLKPLLFPSSFVAWDNLLDMVNHELVKPPAPSKIQQRLKREPQKGEMILAKMGALPFHYRVVGWMGGQGFKPTFAISNRTHIEYDALRSEIKKHLPKRKKTE